MKSFINKIGHSLNSISWPKPKAIINDTLITVLTATILSLAIVIWTSGIEYVIDWVISLF